MIYFYIKFTFLFTGSKEKSSINETSVATHLLFQKAFHFQAKLLCYTINKQYKYVERIIKIICFISFYELLFYFWGNENKFRKQESI